MPSYTVFGLTLSSEIPLPQLRPASDPGDVTIRYGAVPAALEDVTELGPYYAVNSSQVLIRVAGVANYLVQHGSEIVIERDPSADDNAITQYLLGTVSGALLHQRGLLPLHGSAIETPAGAVLFMGIVGSGKSTTAAAFLRSGYRLLADDICAVDFPAGQPIVYPGYPQQKLWADMLDYFADDHNHYQRVLSHMDKFSVPVSEQFCDTPLPLRTIYLLLPKEEVDGVSIEPIEGLWRLRALQTQVYRGDFAPNQGATVPNMRQFSALANNSHIRLCGVFRPSARLRLDELVERIEADFRAAKN